MRERKGLRVSLAFLGDMLHQALLKGAGFTATEPLRVGAMPPYIKERKPALKEGKSLLSESRSQRC